MLLHGSFNLTKLDAAAMQFHLVVEPTEKLKAAVS
jgi:hypothetical protein